MKSILNALKDGRLIELPDNDKLKSLNYLATIIEAIPEIAPGLDIAGSVLKREETANTALGMGWACPHTRVSGDGDMFSAIGWSPAGINYGAPDGKPVHLLVMFYIPDNQKNAYLKEVSALVKAIQKAQGMDKILAAANINDVRNELLNWVSASLDSAMPEAKARIIKLEARQAAVETAPQVSIQAMKLLVPFYIIQSPGGKSIVLSQDRELVMKLEGTLNGGAPAQNADSFEAGGYRVLVRAKTPYQPDRVMYDCLALKA
ncbi:MAG: PTS sugar transporter subunit IIA [Elusimicrobiales bacterium]|nr:PTS sugar transporter subunit IIA [Elusimicrobiales bacterium]